MRIETFRTIIVDASVITEARALAASFPGGEGMFVTPLYTGSEITHYISTGYIDKPVADLLGNPAAFAEATGTDPAQAQAVMDGMDISAEPWPEAIARLGLSTEASDAG